MNYFICKPFTFWCTYGIFLTFFYYKYFQINCSYISICAYIIICLRSLARIGLSVQNCLKAFMSLALLLQISFWQGFSNIFHNFYSINNDFLTFIKYIKIRCYCGYNFHLWRIYSLYTWISDSVPPLDYLNVLSSSLFSFLFFQIVFFFCLLWSLIFHIRGFPKMPDNPGFFTVFKREEPERLSISSVQVMGPIDLEIHSKILWAISWGSLNVSLFSPLLLGWSDLPLANSLNSCLKVKSCLWHSGKKAWGMRRKSHRAVWHVPLVSQVLDVVVIAHLPQLFLVSLRSEILSFKFPESKPLDIQ